ncbi:hypothetical protein [Actinoplanes regularis]|uniref:Uncharacterized protein n=1 Tax=Actinoplanes regularis TaxID=52697 RepID=A0A239H600_9ACTN|nr:hypothetical protein [Actinoplanes regularis]GIE92148.1 hypothetical protein Are01nite_86280 [Actinoplanes regularis]GLW34039.1 hypothetical protein Areg01_69760 [Actinoplanes regularis]SNS76866.1 hypothetical protein SAMN06264365_12378 [Actinoplanes regularis]
MTRLIDEVDLETPEVDAAEQAIPAWLDDDSDEKPAYIGMTAPTSAEADEWDAEEQNRVVEFDDEYR